MTDPSGALGPAARPAPSAPAPAAAQTAADTDMASGAEPRLLADLRRGDEDAFMGLVERHHAALLRLARVYVGDRAVAEEVVQQTWLAVLEGLARFEGRSSLKTWIFRILVNTARSRALREGRSLPFSALGGAESDADEPAVAPERFRPADAAEWSGGWVSFPRRWDHLPEARLLARETLTRIGDAIGALAPNQRAVIRLRDVDGCTAEEVCAILGITEANQRVLLHRARSRVRRALESYLDEERGTP